MAFLIYTKRFTTILVRTWYKCLIMLIITFCTYPSTRSDKSMPIYIFTRHCSYNRITNLFRRISDISANVNRNCKQKKLYCICTRIFKSVLKNTFLKGIEYRYGTKAIRAVTRILDSILTTVFMQSIPVFNITL